MLHEAGRGVQRLHVGLGQADLLLVGLEDALDLLDRLVGEVELRTQRLEHLTRQSVSVGDE